MGVGLSGKRGDRSLKKEEDIFTWRAREDISRIAKVQKSAEKIIQLTFKWCFMSYEGSSVTCNNVWYLQATINARDRPETAPSPSVCPSVSPSPPGTSLLPRTPPSSPSPNFRPLSLSLTSQSASVPLYQSRLHSHTHTYIHTQTHTHTLTDPVQC